MAPRRILRQILPTAMMAILVGGALAQEAKPPFRPLVPKVDAKTCRITERWEELPAENACDRLDRIIATLDGSAPAGTAVPLEVFLCSGEILQQANDKRTELKCK